ncbi:MAG: PAS domain S-box protein [Coriobacteriia bacterium]|nr:PAS domain S-box protein [Coriobacteriia bacterium]
MGEAPAMTPERLGPPHVPRPGSGVVDEEHERLNKTRAIVIIVGALVVITIFNIAAPHTAGGMFLQLVYRRLYLIPIILAAYTFGLQGGVAASLAASIPFVLHTQLSITAGAGMSVDNWLEVATFLVIGVLFGTMRDTEERKAHDMQELRGQLEAAYAKLEDRAIQLVNIQDYTASILRAITSGVVTVGPDGSVATANPAAERMLGMSEFEMVPRPISLMFRVDGGLAADVAKVLAGRLPIAMRETTVVTATGHEVHVQVSTSRMRAVGGTVLGAVVTLEDQSDIKALTDQLIRADRLAAMGELTAGVAHEVRNPLGVIRASVQLLEDAKCDAARIDEAAEVIKQEIDRLDRVIKALLDFGRPSKPTLVRADVNSVLEDVVLFTSRFAAQGNVTIDQNLSRELPTVLGDPDQLKQVFLNLVTNAVQAMAGDGGTIVVETRAANEYVEIIISDTGPGISEKDLPKVFDPFFTKRAEGTGLGLTIVHRILDEHDGHIEVESGSTGTTFTVSLPAALSE